MYTEVPFFSIISSIWMVHFTVNVGCSNKSVASVAWKLSNCSSQEFWRLFGLSNFYWNLLTLYRSMRWNHHMKSPFFHQFFCWLSRCVFCSADVTFGGPRHGRGAVWEVWDRYHLSFFQKGEVCFRHLDTRSERATSSRCCFQLNSFSSLFMVGWFRKTCWSQGPRGDRGQFDQLWWRWLIGQMISTCSIFEVGEVWYRLLPETNSQCP